MKRLLAVLLVGVAPLGATLIAQEKPNFVGTWKLSAPASADMFTPTQITVVQDATDLIVTTTGQMGEFEDAVHAAMGARAGTRSTSRAR